MATITHWSLPSEPQPKTLLSEDLTCIICLDRLKEPKLLPCFHTYCKTCLEGILRRSKQQQIICPQCRSSHLLPTGGVDGFPNDQVLENALDFHSFKESQEKESTLPCSMCTEDDPATVHCSTCGKFLCDFCAKAHKRQVSFRDHKIVTLAQLSSDVVKSLERPRYCTRHPEEILKLYCNTCKTLICRDCSIVGHRDHKYSFVKDVRPDIQRQLREAVKAVTMKQQEFEAHLSFIKEAEITRNMYSVALHKQVNEAFDSFVRSMESLRKQLLGKETTAKIADMKQIWAQKQSIEMTLANIASGLRYMERICGCPGDVDMLAMSSNVQQQLVSLQKTQWNPNSDLTSSPLLIFSSKGQEYVQNTATLESLDSNYCTISLQLEGPPRPKPVSNVQPVRGKHYPMLTTVSIGEKVQFHVEVHVERTTQYITPLTVPSISIKGVSGGSKYYQTNSAKYTMRRKSSGSWLVEFTPLHSGQFTVLAGIYNSQLRSQQTMHVSHLTSPIFFGNKLAQAPEVVSVQPSRTITVTGTFNIGDRVRRGPDWTDGYADGGVGSSGTVISEQEYTRDRTPDQQYQRGQQYQQGLQLGSKGMQLGSQGLQLGSQGMQLGSQGMQLGFLGRQLGSQGMQLGSQGMQLGFLGRQLGSQGMQLGSAYPRHGRKMYVHWNSGNYGQYACNGQCGPYLLEVVPDTEK